MLSKLAIDGGTPVFTGKKANEFAPNWPIPFPDIENNLLEVYRSGKWGCRQKYEKLLEKDFAVFQGAKYAVWMANGTTTIECALLALGVGPGDEVIVPGITWCATVQAPLYCGATPVIVDIDPETLCIDPARIEEAITPHTKAIIPVHVFSAVANMEKIMAIAKKHGLYVIEDCAHAHGARQSDKGAGTFGNVGSFSFQNSKLMTAGEGGCCITNDERLADRIFRLSHIGNSTVNPKLPPEQDLLCHQYRMTDFQAAVIYGQLQHQKELMAKRIENANLLYNLTKDIPGIRMQKSGKPDDVRSYYFVVFLLELDMLESGIDRKKIFAALDAEGIPFYEGWGCPIYKMSPWNTPADQFVKHETPVSEEVSYKTLMQWMHNMLLVEPSVIEKCAEALRKVMNAYTK